MRGRADARNPLPLGADRQSKVEAACRPVQKTVGEAPQMRTVETACDGCGSSLNSTGNCEGYMLALTVEHLPVVGPYVTAMGVSRPLDRDHHFCSISCLDRWRARERVYSNVHQMHWDKWKAEHGTKTEKSESYPYPPDDVRKQWRDDARAKADSEYPLKPVQ